MARQRQYYSEEPNHFAQKHQELLNGVYMTDIDGYQTTFTNCEDQNYMQYTYNSDSTILVRRFVETKSRDTEYIRNVISGEVKPSEQFRAFASVTTELNYFRKANSQPEVECWLVIQNTNNYPYDVFNVTMHRGILSFDFLAQVWDNNQYASLFLI